MFKGEARAFLLAAIGLVSSAFMLAGHQGGRLLVIGALLWCVSWLAMAVRVGRARTALSRTLGRFVSLRLLLLIGIAAAILSNSGDDWAAWGAFIIIGLLLRSEKFIDRTYRYAGVRIADLPGVTTRLRVRLPATIFAGLMFFVILPLQLGLNLWGVSGWWVLAAALVPVAFVAWIALDALRRRRASRKAFDDLPRVIDEMSPKFMVYWASPPKSAFQIAMWIPYLKRIGEPFFIMVRNPAIFNEAVRVADGIPVVLARNLHEVDRLMTSSLGTVFYVNNGAQNTHCIRFAHLTHVQLLHGDSDKAPSFNPVTAMYDKIYVAGQAGIDRYSANGVAIPPEKFDIVGRPQVEQVNVTDRPIDGIEAPSVMYAPTWRGFYEDSEYSSLPYIERILDELLARGCRVILRPHPFSYKDPEFRGLLRAAKTRLSDHAAETGVNHLWGAVAEREMSIAECFNESDAMISDVSSVVADFLYSAKPFAVIAGRSGRDEFIREFPLAAASYVMTSDGDAWSTIIDEMLGDDPLSACRWEMRTHYLGDFSEHAYAEEGFVSTARKLVLAPHEGAPPPVAEVSSTEDPVQG